MKGPQPPTLLWVVPATGGGWVRRLVARRHQFDEAKLKVDGECVYVWAASSGGRGHLRWVKALAT
ncbi:hypothetical protein B9Q06_11655 [Candidatus Marsarchaeota G2 archaeon ECH_B_2]|uniref:Uncharacterized protein n=3 Tax=Candidatus Marsarchaeota group 2 TaxID=2203771 RepID=A0A2R6B4Q4_9ARCH|nr:MAG: hypothetical protein B9Q06_11655 [Candidatus Marsarchaeota G2 archaeon ECH_B_2]PSN97744.1 MAG: hypothetical protein B9Q07_11425 [Candidatus Marsarchaeota G2 archaeon ECH_B_3]PSO01209.1 MAG: hypothetical protein B9Q05_09020 [Candidatus Marsarchaeota G2 archaeon ECH_B_1]